MEQLSGGEKSIASLALQYALAVSSRSPFLILDESDAYLDAGNVGKLLRLMEESLKGIYFDKFREEDSDNIDNT